MRWLVDGSEDSEKVSEVIQAAGGRIVGRTRLQKMFYLLDAAGFEADFSFEYRHYGPYSEKLTRATSVGCVEGIIREDEFPATWGGTYSVFTSTENTANAPDKSMVELLRIANDSNSIDLELAATAIFLSKENVPDPWRETLKRKPEKAQRIENAKRLMEELSALTLPIPLPRLA